MKKTLLGTLVGSALALLSVQANAENLQTIYQLATKKDPQVLKAAATRDAAKAGIDRGHARQLVIAAHFARVARAVAIAVLPDLELAKLRVLRVEHAVPVAVESGSQALQDPGNNQKKSVGRQTA